MAAIDAYVKERFAALSEAEQDEWHERNMESHAKRLDFMKNGVLSLLEPDDCAE